MLPSLASIILGYRGCFVRDNINREWLVFGTGVTLKINGSCESRLDRQRIFEKLLLSSAPMGVCCQTFVLNMKNLMM